MRTVSLCSGIGGLELALPNAEVAVFAETDPAENAPALEKQPAAVLAAHWPDVENIGDWTDWVSFDRWAPDLIMGGLPCQSVSQAGLGQGEKDVRWLFDDLLRMLQLGRSRPILFLENVRGILRRKYRPALARFRLGLEGLGYRVDSMTMPASDVGAPHERMRWWAVCWPPDRTPQWALQSPPIPTDKDAVLPTPVARDHKGRRFNHKDAGLLTDLLPTPLAADDHKRAPSKAKKEPSRYGLTFLLPTPIGSDALGPINQWALSGKLMGPPPSRRFLPTPVKDGPNRYGSRLPPHLFGTPDNDSYNLKTEYPRLADERGRIAADGWGTYQHAINGWTGIVGRPPPEQIQHPGVIQLDARFVEWMMGFPEGWVSMLPNRHAVRALGNAVVPLQAREAARRLRLLEVME